MSNTLPTNFVIEKQVPRFVRENHPKFIQFLEKYYEFLDQDENINDYIKNVIDYIDPDKTSLDFLLNFFDELKGMPKNFVADKRLLAKHIYDLYDAKGTAKAIELLFRILFNEKVEITYPSENMLIASDGRWKQDIFITISPKNGNLLLNSAYTYTLENNDSTEVYKIFPSSIQYDLLTNTYRVFFPATETARISEGQFFIVNNLSNKIFSGIVVKSPYKLNIISGGKSWQRGAIIKIPGNNFDTIARVINTDEDGKLTGLEILQYGYGHSENQTITTSPYSQKPTNSNVDITYSGTTYTVNVTDYLDYSSNVIGITSGATADSYYLDDYSSDMYSGSDIINVDYNTSTTSGVNTNNDITTQEWLDSRTVLVYKYDIVGRPKGDWNSDRGKISTTSIRLQDNYYYQLFSYAIKTEKCINRWKNAVSLFHPAGLKFFGEFYKLYIDDYSNSFTGTTTISIT